LPFLPLTLKWAYIHVFMGFWAVSNGAILLGYCDAAIASVPQYRSFTPFETAFTLMLMRCGVIRITLPSGMFGGCMYFCTVCIFAL